MVNEHGIFVGLFKADVDLFIGFSELHTLISLPAILIVIFIQKKSLNEPDKNWKEKPYQ